MLKITVTETPTEQRWVLEGQLTHPWVAALRLHWRKTRSARQGRTCVVDLNDITGIDQHGERVLRTMMREGAQCLARGVFTTYLLAAIAPQQKEADAPVRLPAPEGAAGSGADGALLEDSTDMVSRRDAGANGDT
jgi:ABC-type transporter Mla MlaB component